MNSNKMQTGNVPEASEAKRDAGARPSLDSENQQAQRVLEQLREELDAFDAVLMETLRLRLDCCCRIGQHKREHAIPMMQPQRIGVVQARAAAFAAEHGLSPEFLRSLYELIIAETCRLEDEIIGTSATSA